MMNSANIASMDGMIIPDRLTVGDEFELHLRVRVYELRRERIDVSSMEREAYLDGSLHADLVVVEDMSANKERERS